MLHQEKDLPNDSGMPLSKNNFTDDQKKKKKKKKWLLLINKKQCFFSVFCIELSLHLPSFKVRSLQVTMNFVLV